MKEHPLLRADPTMIAYGEFHGDGVLGDLAKLKLTDEQASAYANAKPGDALNLSSDEVASREGSRRTTGAARRAIRRRTWSRSIARRA
jgi:hypothetical protein